MQKLESHLSSGFGRENIITIEDVDKISGPEFEILAGLLFEKMGYNVTITKHSGEQGADLIIEKFGERIVVQTKNWENNVTNKAIQEVVTSI